MPTDESERFQHAIDQLYALSRDSETRHNDLQAACAKEYTALAVATARIEEKLTAITASITANACPSPGLCKDLESRIDVQRADITTLETNQAEAKGGWKGLMAVGGLIGGATGFVALLVEWFKKP